MNTKEMTHERISAFADGELADQQVDVALAVLRQPEGQADWEIYHQIGDVLRSDDMALALSPGFTARMFARIEAEPTIVAPAIPAQTEEQTAVAAAVKRTTKRWAMPSMVAAAAMAAFAFVTTPQLMVAMRSEPASGELAQIATSAPTSEKSVVVADSISEGVVLRDPRIDDYLLAHQRFSPSVYSTAQYARSATFSNK